MMRILSLGAGVQSTTLALMAASGEIPPIDHAIFGNNLLDACNPSAPDLEPGGLDELFPFLFDAERQGFVMVLGAYFDESARTDGDEPFCVGGYLFKPSQYTRFRKRWHREVLRLPDRRQLRHFHMTDLCAGKGVYDGLDIATRLGILRRAVDVVAACAYAAVGVHFMQAEVEALAPPEFAKYRGSIYSQACGILVQVTAFRLREWRCNNMDVMYVLERGHKFQNEANDIFNAIAQDPRAGEFKYRQHLFEYKDREYGLQAADLYAWSITKARSINGGPIPRAFKPFVGEVLRLSQCLPGRQSLNDFSDDRLKQYLRAVCSIANGYVPVKFGPRPSGLR